MSHRARILRNIAIGLATLIAVVLVAAVVILRTDWFREYVRKTIISSTEESTGGRVELGSFNFDESKLRATVRNLVIHGYEPATARPFVSVPLVEVDLRLFTSLSHLYQITFLGIDQPEVNIMLLADGRTNIPSPKTKSTSNKSGLATVVDLAVEKFVLNRGLFTFLSVKQPLTVRGNNLRARLDYSAVRQGYDGDFAIEPLYILNGRNTPVNFKVDLPVTLLRDRIDFHHATITTPLSQIQADASIDHMDDPKFTGHIQGRVAGADLVNAGNVPIDPKNLRLLPDLSLDANATADSKTVQVTALHAGLGQTHIEGSGYLKDPQGRGDFQLRADLALGELGRIAGLAARPEGSLSINARARLDQANRYDANGNISAKNLSFTQGKERISNITFESAFHADPATLKLDGLRLSAFGGEFLGNAALTNFEQYTLQGQLRGIAIEALAKAAGQKLPYSGAISGDIDARGDTKQPGAKSIVANAHLTITPGRRGIPVSGRLNADYNGAADDVSVQNTFVALPHTRLDVNGTLGKRLNLVLKSKDLNDLLAATPTKGPPPVTLAPAGEADFTGAVSGSLSSPRITGHLAVNKFAIENRAFDSLAADLAASQSSATVSNVALTRNAMQAHAEATIGLRGWAPVPRSPLNATVSVSNGDLADLMAMAGQPSEGYSGALAASARVTGTYGNPLGAATIEANNGTISNEPFNQIRLQVNLADQLVTVPTGYITAPPGRIDLSADFRHPRDSFTTGQLHARVQSGNLDLSRAANVEKSIGQASGTAQLTADVAASLREQEPKILVTSVTADVSARRARVRGIDYGDLTASATTSGQTVSYTLNSNFAGSNIRANGRTELVPNYPTTADLDISGLPVERVLAAAQQSSIPARGVLTGTAHVNGTLAAPEGNARIDLTNAVIYDEKIDQAHVTAAYLSQSIDVSRFQVVSGPSHIDATAHYDHPAGNLQTGRARFTLATNHVDLSRLANVQKVRQGLGGILDINAEGAADVQMKDPRVLLTTLNANVSATGIAAQGKQFGDLKLTANTQGGQRLAFALDSNLAGSTIHGSGSATLNPQYPVDAQLSFRNIQWTRIAELTGSTGSGPATFDAFTDGDVTVRGPLMTISQLDGSLALSRLSVNTIPRTGAGRPVTIANQGPIQIALNHGQVQIQSAHLTGPKTDIQASGSAGITGDNLNLSLRANADLGVIQEIDRNVYAQGTIALNATIRGSAAKPLSNGEITLQNAAFSAEGVPIGVSNANGTVVLNGNSAQIRNLTADSGGGRLSLAGFATYSELLRFGVRADATNIRLRVQQGVSVTADAAIRVSGTTENSRIGGTATVNRVTYAPQSDLGSILTRSGPPVQSPDVPSPLLSNMKLDIRIRNSAGMTVQSALSQDLQADIDLHVRGTANEPGVQGRVTISEGKLVFFGTTYTVNTGTISFYNPIRIDPVLDVSLQALAQGVNVTLQVTGPIDNMKLSYTSDPPLQFQEIVSLLASGKTPTSDPTLLANQPTQPAQSVQQLGESAVLGQAVANPVANQLQRVFGVSQLKIDPSFASGSNVPTARLALQQRITNNVTFTYVSAIDQPNSSLIRVEWAFSPQWAAVATRDQNGIFSVNFFYKRAFH